MPDFKVEDGLCNSVLPDIVRLKRDRLSYTKEKPFIWEDCGKCFEM